MGSTTAASRPGLARQAPVDVRNTPTAKLFTHLHPVCLLALLYAGFDALVTDPVQALFGSLPLLALVQVTYAINCLPVAGLDEVVAAKKTTPKKRAAAVDRSLRGRIIPALLSTVLAVVLGPPVLSLVMILFGAPLTTHLMHTLLAATHVALLAGMPLVYVHGVDAARWKAVVSAALPLDEVFGASVGCFVGAWLGAVPIPLDWDREWQKWPVTIVTGAYCGCVVGKLIGGYLVKGRTMSFD